MKDRNMSYIILAIALFSIMLSSIFGYALLNNGIQGEKGEPGIQGDQGIQGLIGSQGIPGDEGDKGNRGSSGSDGDDGEDGKDGICKPHFKEIEELNKMRNCIEHFATCKGTYEVCMPEFRVCLASI